MNLKQQRTRQRKQEKHRRKRKAEAVRERYDPNDVRWVATHEAGHAVAALAYGIPLEFVDIRRRELPNGQVSVGFTRTPRMMVSEMAGRGEESALPLMIQILAGPAAEAQADSRYTIKVGSDACDGKDAYRIAHVELFGRTGTPISHELTDRRGKVEVLYKRAEAEAIRLVAGNRAAIEAVATALIRKTSLTGEEVAALVVAATTTQGASRPRRDAAPVGPPARLKNRRSRVPEPPVLTRPKPGSAGRPAEPLQAPARSREAGGLSNHAPDPLQPRSTT